MRTPRIPDTRRCAAPSGRVDVTPSPVAATLAGLWLALVCLIALIAVDLPLPARIGLCLFIATPGVVTIRRVFLLRGAGAVRSIRWNQTNTEFRVSLGNERELAARLGRGSFRLGASNLYLRFETCDRTHAVFIQADRQEMRAFRSLCRRLGWPPREP